MGRLDSLFETTIEMYSILKKLENNELERETVIEQIEELIQKRGEQIKQITAPYSDEEMKMGQKIVQYDEQIKVKMDRLYEEVKDDMKKVKQKKFLNRSYINPYGKIKTTDGMYLDSKQ